MLQMDSSPKLHKNDQQNNDLFDLKCTNVEPTDIDIYTRLGRTDYMDANPDKFWTHEQICNYSIEEMRALIRKELDCDFTFPGSYDVLVRHYTMAEYTENGLFIPKDDIQDSTNFTSTIGKVLAYGPEAFRYKPKFPAGNSRCLVGQYCEFVQYNNKAKMVGDYAISIIADDQIKNILPSNVSNLSSVKKIG